MVMSAFSPIRPFEKKDPVSSKLQSDHCEVALKTSLGTINSWNISNPAYHKFFANDESQVFAQTVLADTNIDVLNVKIESQLETIANRLLDGAVNIQVIVEGYETFYEKLAEKIGDGEFHLLAEKPEGWTKTKNITGIVVDNSKFSIRTSAVINVDYQEEGRDSVLRVPYVHVQEVISRREMIVVGVHVPGTASQYPEKGLSALAKVIDGLWEKYDKKVDVIGIGDFNSTPENVAKHFKTVLEPSYWTHANPRFAAASKYDMAIVREAEQESSKPEMLPSDALSDASRALAKGLELLIV